MNFLQQAFKGRNSWWRWGIPIVLLTYPYWQGVYQYFFEYDAQLASIEAIKAYDGDKNQIVFGSLKPYFGYLLVLLLSVKFLHRRKITSIFNAFKSVNYLKILFSFVSFGVCIMLFFILEYASHENDYILHFKSDKFFVLLALSLFIVPIKVVFLEAFFRGYLMQLFAMITKSKWLSVVIISVIYGGIFGLHATTDLVPGLLMYYIITDIFLGIITLMDDGIELAIGVHWATNAIGYLIVSHQWHPLVLDSIFLDTSNSPNLLFLLYIPVFVFYPLYILFLSKVYKWKNWKEKLFGKVNIPT